MTTRMRAICILLPLVAGACNNQTMLPDAQNRAPGSISRDGGFGLGSGGFTSPPVGSGGTNTTTTQTTAACVASGGFGLGSGGKEDPCATSPTS